ncbi:MAG TPA: mechanosensitive ion channel domain-containing protein [Gaiellaceae bacterium]|nr:mechanosensitive ion channel domain-containing protein [Gaiellaceae bacterium]
MGRVLALELSEEVVEALVTAGVGVVGVLAVRFAAYRLLRGYERRLAARDPQEAARRRTLATVLARLAVAAVAILVVWTLLSIFPQTDRLAQAVLASGAFVALVLGLAIATPLANLGSGVLLAFTQPVRLGDRITVGEHTGVVEEITLSYTALVTDEDDHVFVPNREMVSRVIVNRTARDPRRLVSVRLPVALDRPLAEARAAVLEAARGTEQGEALSLSARIGEVGEKVAWLELVAYVSPDADVARLTSDLREAALAALGEAGYLPS